jgi:hypothetical protein
MGAQLGVILPHVHVCPVTGEYVRATGAAYRRLEPGVRGDHVVGQDAAIAPATDAGWSGRNPFADGIVHSRQHVLHVLVAPVGVDHQLNFSPRPELPRGLVATTT